MAQRSLRPAGGAFLWQIRHLRTLEHQPAQGPQAAGHAAVAPEAWLATEQGPVFNRHPLGPGENWTDGMREVLVDKCYGSLKFVFQVYTLNAASYRSLPGQRPQGCTVQKVKVIDFLKRMLAFSPANLD